MKHYVIGGLLVVSSALVVTSPGASLPPRPQPPSGIKVVNLPPRMSLILVNGPNGTMRVDGGPQVTWYPRTIYQSDIVGSDIKTSAVGAAVLRRLTLTLETPIDSQCFYRAYGAPDIYLPFTTGMGPQSLVVTAETVEKKHSLSIDVLSGDANNFVRRYLKDLKQRVVCPAPPKGYQWRPTQITVLLKAEAVDNFNWVTRAGYKFSLNQWTLI